jgi:hypothetical protein
MGIGDEKRNKNVIENYNNLVDDKNEYKMNYT